MGKFGSLPANLLLGRPYHLTYEILERRADEPFSRLRVVSPDELNAEAMVGDAAPSESREDVAEPARNGVPEAYDLIAEDGTVVMKNNRLTIDDASRQALSQAEIEELKRSAGGKEIIEKILANHTALDEKTAFSRAKYTLRKSKKYLKRFTVLPMELGYLIDYVLEKEPARIMEMREETLGLICSWSNVHFTGVDEHYHDREGKQIGGGRNLVIDETGGLMVAALAERMGILRSDKGQAKPGIPGPDSMPSSVDHLSDVADGPNGASTASSGPNGQADGSDKTFEHRDFPIPASTNSITLLHSAVQPNVSVLKYFGYDTNQPDPDHPLHTHLKSLSWLQLLNPEDDPLYREPEKADGPALDSWKTGKRGMYFKKRRRWERCKSIIDEAGAGGFDGLVIASHMDLATVLPHTVPLVRGGGHVVIYSPTIEPLVKVVDLYSKERRTAYNNLLAQHPDVAPDDKDFPVDPRLLLAPTLQTSRVREWQVLPGRTHPMMTGRGGSEGYVFTARRVIPLEGGVEARGNYGKRRKVEPSQGGDGSPPS